MTKQEIKNLTLSIYEWFNQISDIKNSLQRSDLEKYFTSDFVMQLNDKIITYDYDSLLHHFNAFRENGYKLDVRLPLQEIIISDDHQKCVARYEIFKTLSCGVISEIKVIAIWHLSNDGRMQRMNEVVCFDNSSL